MKTKHLFQFQTTIVLSQLFDLNDENALVPFVRTKHQIAADLRGHTHVELIDVKCDANAGMLVSIEFEEVFSGIIYSQGYFNDPKCR